MILAAEIVAAAEPAPRYVQKINLPDAAEIVVIAEGEFEPRSVGSYTLRIYSGANPKFPLDDYVTGIIRPRSGTVEEVRFDDLDGDGRAEIIVMIRSVGTGGFLAADVFAYTDKSLKLFATLNGLAKDSDPIAELKERVRKRLQ